jgi:HK97 gp10 family phage protein
MGTFGDKWLKDLQRRQGQNLDRAAYYLENHLKQAISVKEKGHRSEPGEFPHVQSGELRRSITHITDKKELTARIGSGKIYARYLELGTSKMDPRPFIGPILNAHLGAIKNILEGK